MTEYESDLQSECSEAVRRLTTELATQAPSVRAYVVGWLDSDGTVHWEGSGSGIVQLGLATAIQEHFLHLNTLQMEKLDENE